jgi:DNA-directed RNA polymerase subunit H
MHVLQPRHVKLKPEEAKALFKSLNVNPSQLPKIKKDDPALSGDAKIGDIIRIDRKTGEKLASYYRVVVP